MNQRPKAVVLLSGGIDSSTAAYWAKEERGYDVIGLTLLYGQRASKEAECAKKIADAVGTISHRIVNLNSLRDVFVSPLTRGMPPLAVDQNDRPGSSYYIVPLRNLVFMGIACAMAESYDADYVIIGAHLDDYEKGGFPDCSEAFYDSLRETVKLGTGEQHRVPTISQPWWNTSKSDIIEEGFKLGVPFDKTWSCYLNGDKPCLKCESCIYRAEAFEALGQKDPLLNA